MSGDVLHAGFFEGNILCFIGVRGVHAREKQKVPMRAIVERDLFLSASSFFFLIFFFLSSSLTQNRALN